MLLCVIIYKNITSKRKRKLESKFINLVEVHTFRQYRIQYKQMDNSVQISNPMSTLLDITTFLD